MAYTIVDSLIGLAGIVITFSFIVAASYAREFKRAR